MQIKLSVIKRGLRGEIAKCWQKHNRISSGAMRGGGGGINKRGGCQ